MQQITFEQLKLEFNKYKIEVEQVLVNELNLLWFDDWYDGALCGIIEYKKQKLRFEIITDYEMNIFPRTFALLKITEEQIEEETYWHYLFEKHVSEKPKQEHHLFYEEYQKRVQIDYNFCLATGWFIDSTRQF